MSFNGKREQVNIRTINRNMWTSMPSQEGGNTYHNLFSFYIFAEQTCPLMEGKLKGGRLTWKLKLKVMTLNKWLM